MRVIDLFKDSNRVPVVPTKKATFESFSGPLEVEAGHERNDRTIRGCVRLVIDPDGGRGGGIATRIVRPGARRHGGAFHDEPKLMDVLEILRAGGYSKIKLVALEGVPNADPPAPEPATP